MQNGFPYLDIFATFFVFTARFLFELGVFTFPATPCFPVEIATLGEDSCSKLCKLMYKFLFALLKCFDFDLFFEISDFHVAKIHKRFLSCKFKLITIINH